ncbi:hypothetical protein CHN50_14165 [Priestia aryabhattai]|uniref:hypothetical protein n=1 Tax=Priestia TaxID=2800373 RepID=UPI000BA11EE0|nr:hypothetical protein [Priestia flexa]MDT2046194.1 hypothetical protein [Priestia flexa]OZT12034.1 hypothetical protein CHN50_14165 [Priestia aryabhattai]USY53781.1 hypothetical protein NIZ91_13570 [Bacillus sp. 1780r2a1]
MPINDPIQFLDVRYEAIFYHSFVSLSTILPQLIKIRDSIAINQFKALTGTLLTLFTARVSVSAEQINFLQQATNEINNVLSDASISRQLIGDYVLVYLERWLFLINHITNFKPEISVEIHMIFSEMKNIVRQYSV